MALAAPRNFDNVTLTRCYTKPSEGMPNSEPHCSAHARPGSAPPGRVGFRHPPRAVFGGDSKMLSCFSGRALLRPTLLVARGLGSRRRAPSVRYTLIIDILSDGDWGDYLSSPAAPGAL